MNKQIKHCRIGGSFRRENNKLIFRDELIITNRTGSIVEIDNDNNRILINPDITGIDKIYFFIKDHQLIISSRFKDLIHNPIDEESMQFQIKHGYVPYPFTILKGVRKAPPGLCIILKFNDTGDWEYGYEPSSELNIFNADEKFNRKNFKRDLNILFAKNFKTQQDLVSSFSGGFDSLLLTWFYKKACKGILHFNECISNEHSEDKLAYYKRIFPEAEWAVLDNNADFTEEDKRIYFNSIDEPSCDSAGFAEYLMAREMNKKDNMKSMPIMNGQATDALFCTGREYFQDYVSAKLRTAGFLRAIASAKNNSYLAKLHNYTLDVKDRFFAGYYRNFDFSEESWQEFQKIYDIYESSIDNDSTNFYAILMFLLKYSIHGVEKIKTASRAFNTRYYLPFMSKEILSYAFSIPAKYKVGYKSGKRILVDSYPEISSIKYQSGPFLPDKLKERLIEKDIGGNNYEIFFTQTWMKYNKPAPDQAQLIQWMKK